MTNTKKIARTAAIANYLIERVGRDQVDMCEMQGDQWITIRSKISRSTAARFGFNLQSPRVAAVFDGVE
jgi:hypothetical protein